jgi:biotin carboxylase
LGKIVFIGGSQDHVPFIEAAIKMGYSTVVFDRDENCNGAKIADTFFKISTHDSKQIISKCKALNKTNKICGTMTYSSAAESLFATANVCRLLKLPSFTLKSIELATDKILMKESFIKFRVPTPGWTSTNTLQEAINYFKKSGSMPLIMKPSAGGQGSIGVALVKQVSDIVDQYQNSSLSSNDSKVILERYYQGQEFSIDGIMVGDMPIVLAVSEKHSLGGDFNFIMSGFSIINADEKKQYKEDWIKIIKETALQAVNAMGITNSFFSVDIVDTKKGFMVLECGVLLDCKIDRLLKYVDIDVYKMMINLIIGDDKNLEIPSSIKSACLSFLFVEKEGLFKINNLFEKKYDGKIEWEKHNGEYVRLPRSIADAVGWLINHCDHVTSKDKPLNLFSVE